jgi:hypothetical protein
MRADEHAHEAQGSSPAPKPGIPLGAPDWWGHSDAPWDNFTIQWWVDQINAVPWKHDGTEFWKAVACPRCTHPISFKISGGSFEESLEVENRTNLDLGDGQITDGSCNCQTASATHPGRPEGTTEGCGQNGWIRQP